MGNTQYHKLCLVGRIPHTPLAVKDIKYLALGAGSIRGIALIGAYKALLDKGLQKPLGIAGSSVGAMIAVAIAVGLQPTEMKEMITFPDYRKVNTNYKWFISCGKLSYIDPTPLKQELDKMLIRHGVNPKITFKQFLKKTGVDIRIVAYNIKTNKSETFSAANTPDNEVIGATMASGSMPIVFPPSRQLTPDKTIGCYVDGAVKVEIPFHEFPANSTLGLYLFDKYRLRTIGTNFFTPLTNLQKDHIISIDVSRVGALQLSPTQPMVNWLYNQGLNGITNYYNKKKNSNRKDSI